MTAITAYKRRVSGLCVRVNLENNTLDAMAKGEVRLQSAK